MIEFIESWISQDFSGKNYHLHVMVRQKDRTCHINIRGFVSIGEALQREEMIANAIQYRQQLSEKNSKILINQSEQ